MRVRPDLLARRLSETLASQVCHDLEIAHCKFLDRDAHPSQFLVGDRRKPQLVALTRYPAGSYKFAHLASDSLFGRSRRLRHGSHIGPKGREYGYLATEQLRLTIDGETLVLRRTDCDDEHDQKFVDIAAASLPRG